MAHEGLWQQLIALDRQGTAKRAKCRYLSEPERYIITLLGSEYVVNPAKREIFLAQSGSQPTPAEYLGQLCILAYLINAKDLPPVGKLVKEETLAGGQFFFRGLHSLATGKLEKAFGEHPKRLYRLTEQFNAKKCEFGDASIELYVLPRVPLTIVVWGRCDEFESRASILFDQTAGDQLPLDALWAAANLTIGALVKASET